MVLEKSLRSFKYRTNQFNTLSTLSHASLDMDVSINFKLIKLGHDFCNVMLPEKIAILTDVKV